MTRRALPFLALLVVVGGSAAAAPDAPRPTGLLVSAGPSRGQRVAVDPTIPFARGTLVRAEWSQLEPHPGVFAWGVLDAE